MSDFDFDDAVKRTIAEQHDRISALEAQNDKLRELCKKALVALENNCSQCAYFYDCDILTDCKCVAPKKIRAELRELGVGVDG